MSYFEIAAALVISIIIGAVIFIVFASIPFK